MSHLWRVPILGARPEAESPLVHLLLESGIDEVFVMATSPLDAVNTAEERWIVDDSRIIYLDGTDYSYRVCDILDL